MPNPYPPPEKKKIIVFFGIPDPINKWEYYCNMAAHKDAEANGSWFCALHAVEPDRAEPYLGDSMRFRGGTEYALVLLDKASVVQSTSYPQGYNYDASIEVGRLTQEWKRTRLPEGHPPGVQGAAVVDEKDKPIPCGFCEKPAANPQGTPHCGVHGPHVSAAILHDRRLLTGGLADCPETRAESLRFAERRRVQVELDQARIAGYCTQNDLAQGARPTVTERAFKDGRILEEIPLAGQTPHYEWP